MSLCSILNKFTKTVDTHLNKWECAIFQIFLKGPSINVNIFMSVHTKHFLRTPPAKKEYTSTFFDCQKSQMKIIKIRPKLKSVLKKCWFSQTPHSPPKVYDLYTHENVDIYGWPLNELQFRLDITKTICETNN